MNAAELKNRIVSGGLDEKLTVLYGKDQLEAQKVRRPRPDGDRREPHRP